MGTLMVCQKERWEYGNVNEYVDSEECVFQKYFPCWMESMKRSEMGIQPGNFTCFSQVILKMDCPARRIMKASGNEWGKSCVGDGTMVGNRIQPFTAICWLSSSWRVCAGLLFTGARECSRVCLSSYGWKTWALEKRRNFRLRGLVNVCVMK